MHWKYLKANMLLRELTQPTASTVDEAKKRKRKARRTTGMSAAYGPGPYGGYGYYAGYSGDSGGGDGGGESIAHENFVSETAMMGKIADSGKIIRILKKAHTVPFSDEKNWLLVDMDPAKGNKGLGIKWIPADTRFEWVRPYRDSVDENFADGKNPQDKGDAKRHGVNTKGSVSSLRKVAKQGGRKGQLAHWMANMKAGKKKSLNEAVIHPGIMDALEDFLPFVMRMLKLDKLPKISVHKTIETGDQPSFGGYDMENNSIELALKDRHPADILRTLAHELVHYKQNTTHSLHDRSGLTGSPEENQANSQAGIIMRHFNKRFPQYLE
jgi:hypothetical protein